MEFSTYALYFGITIILIFIVYLISLIFLNRNCFKSILNRLEN